MIAPRTFLRPGFTLVELIVALAIAALVLVGARAILEQLADSADRTTRAAIDTDRIANTDRMTRALFEHTMAADDAHPFSGSIQSAHFWSWCDVPMGWSEPCTVAIAIVPDSSHDHTATDSLTSAPVASSTGLVRVNVSTSAGDTLSVREHLRVAELRYLDDAADGGHWTIGWPGGVTTPLAVGVVTPLDTLVFRIGARR